MFKRKHRFSFRKGIPNKTIHSKSFVIRYGENGEFLKTAFVVGKKIDKKAVGRNKIKREMVKIFEGLLDKKTKSSIIVFAKKQILEVDRENLKKEFKETFEKIKII